MLCAGALAVRYEALGGSVAWHGKPRPAIYDLCLARLGGPPRDRVGGDRRLHGNRHRGSGGGGLRFPRWSSAGCMPAR